MAGVHTLLPHRCRLPIPSFNQPALSPLALLPCSYTARVELSSKVLDCFSKLERTLCHELCHVAAWLVNHTAKPPHGPVFRSWAAKAMRLYSHLDITTCHAYEIFYPFRWGRAGGGWQGSKVRPRVLAASAGLLLLVLVMLSAALIVHRPAACSAPPLLCRWQCSNGTCLQEYGRHSNSIDVTKKVCGACRSPLVFLGKFKPDGTVSEEGG